MLRKNVVRNNDFGLGGRDLNGRDMFYDGTGTQNCFSGNTLRSPNLPVDNSTFAPCPAPAANTQNQAAQDTAIGWIAGVNSKKTRRRSRSSGSGTRTRPRRASSRWCG